MKHLKHLKDKIKKLKNKIAIYTANGTEATNISVIFLLGLGKALAGVGHYILFPVAMGSSAIGSLLIARHAHLKGFKDHRANSDAVATILTSLGVIASLILIFVGQSVLTTVGSVLLTGVIGAKGLYNLSAAIYNWYKYLKHRHLDPEKADKYFRQAREDTVAFVVDALIAGSAAAVFIAHKPTFGLIGMVGGLIGASYAAYSGCRTYQAYKREKEKEEQELARAREQNPGLENELMNSAVMYSQLVNVNVNALNQQAQNDVVQQDIPVTQSPSTVATTNTNDASVEESASHTMHRFMR